MENAQTHEDKTQSQKSNKNINSLFNKLKEVAQSPSNTFTWYENDSYMHENFKLKPHAHNLLAAGCLRLRQFTRICIISMNFSDYVKPTSFRFSHFLLFVKRFPRPCFITKKQRVASSRDFSNTLHRHAQLYKVLSSLENNKMLPKTQIKATRVNLIAIEHVNFISSFGKNRLKL